MCKTFSALEKIDANEVVELTRQLVRIPSENPPGNEREIAEFVTEKLRDLGLTVKVHEFKPGRPSVVGLLTGAEGKPVLMFNGHLDTVPIGDREDWSVDPFEGALRNGKIYGRGAADMKGALAAMIASAKAVIESKVRLKGKLILTFVADEEVTGYGTRDLIRKGYKADFAVIGEPNELKVQTAHKGVLRLKVVTRGKAAHASIPHQGVNAIYRMADVCLALEKMNSLLAEKKHALLGSPTINVGTIKGGIKTNIVPDYCEITVDRRLIPGERPMDVKREIEEVLESLRWKTSNLQTEVEVLNVAEPSETPQDEPIVQVAREAVKEVVGRDPGVTGFTATCDMHFLVNEADIPTIILGPGSLQQAHIVDEYVEVEQLINAAKVYTCIILKTLG
ncbi:M20 family metallopeptidase [Candidatus Bathyarchaeota archaeon]|nr:M20 family metallopeptidase [Candidatus Bathyarchaeota archaeon]